MNTGVESTLVIFQDDHSDVFLGPPDATGPDADVAHTWMWQEDGRNDSFEVIINLDRTVVWNGGDEDGNANGTWEWGYDGKLKITDPNNVVHTIQLSRSSTGRLSKMVEIEPYSTTTAPSRMRKLSN